MSNVPSQRILVVEDHAGLRAQLVAVLAGAGWLVEEASDGRLALQMALEQPPDVLSPDALPEGLADGLALDEVGELARHLDRLHARTRALRPNPASACDVSRRARPPCGLCGSPAALVAIDDDRRGSEFGVGGSLAIR